MKNCSHWKKDENWEDHNPEGLARNILKTDNAV